MSVPLYFYARVCMFLCSKYFLCECPYISMPVPVCFYARTYFLLVSLYLYTRVSMFLCFKNFYAHVCMFLWSCPYDSML